MFVRWWCWPPAKPLPPGCFLCLPIRPWPAETCPRLYYCVSDIIMLKGPMMTDCFLVFVFLVGIFAYGRCEDAVVCSRCCWMPKMVSGAKKFGVEVMRSASTALKTQALRHQCRSIFMSISRSFYLHSLAALISFFSWSSNCACM